MIFLTDPLQYTLHRDLRWTLANQFRFASAMPCVPAAAFELKDLAGHVPLVLQAQGNGFRVVVPLRPAWTKAPVISEDGAWLRGPPPVLLRYHPFTLLRDGTGKGDDILAVAADPAWLSTETGQPFFDESGQPSATIQVIHRLLSHVEAENRKLSTAIQALEALQLLHPLNLTDARGRQPFQTVSVPSLAALSVQRWTELAEHHQVIAYLTTALGRSQRQHLPLEPPDAQPDARQARRPATGPSSSGFLVNEEIILSF